MFGGHTPPPVSLVLIPVTQTISSASTTLSRVAAQPLSHRESPLHSHCDGHVPQTCCGEPMPGEQPHASCKGRQADGRGIATDGCVAWDVGKSHSCGARSAPASLLENEGQKSGKK